MLNFYNKQHLSFQHIGITDLIKFDILKEDFAFNFVAKS